MEAEPPAIPAMKEVSGFIGVDFGCCGEEGLEDDWVD